MTTFKEHYEQRVESDRLASQWNKNSLPYDFMGCGYLKIDSIRETKTKITIAVKEHWMKNPKRITDEEKVHVGELQYALETLNDNINDKIDSGKEEAEEHTSGDNSTMEEALQKGDHETADHIQQLIDFYEDREDDYYTQGRFSDKLNELEQQLQESAETEQTYIKDEIEQLIDDVYEQRKIGLAAPEGE